MKWVKVSAKKNLPFTVCKDFCRRKLERFKPMVRQIHINPF